MQAQTTISMALRNYRYSFVEEKKLQAGVELALLEQGYAFQREFRLSTHDIVDFLVEPGIALEVKIAGGLSAVTRQIHRYAQHDQVAALVLVTTWARHGDLPDTLNGKPVRVVMLLGGLL